MEEALFDLKLCLQNLWSVVLDIISPTNGKLIILAVMESLMGWHYIEQPDATACLR